MGRDTLQLGMWRAPPGVCFAGMLRAPAAPASCACGVGRAVGCGGSCSRARAPHGPLVQAQVIKLPLSVINEHLEGPMKSQKSVWAQSVLNKTGHCKR